MSNADSGTMNKPLGSLVSLRKLAEEWSTSRQTVRRVLKQAGIHPVYLNDARNGTLRYSRDEVGRFVEKCRMQT